MKLRESLISKLCLGVILGLTSTSQAYAATTLYTWTGTTNNDLNLDTNWSSDTGLIPASDDFAQFRSGPTNITPTVAGNQTIGTIYFGDTPSSYTFNWAGAYTLTLNLDGIDNNSHDLTNDTLVPITQVFNVSNGGTLLFTGETAASNPGYYETVQLNVGGTNGGTLQFDNNATAAESLINGNNYGNIIFDDTSKAYYSLMYLDSTSSVTFNAGSLSQGAYIQSTGNANGVTFNNNSVAGDPSDIYTQTEIVLSNSKLQFLNASDPHSAFINASGNSQIVLNTSTISGNGGPIINLSDTAELVVAQNNTISSLNSSVTSTEVVLGTNTLTTNEHPNIYSGAATNDVYAGLITGTGHLVKTGTGSLSLTGTQNNVDTWDLTVNEGSFVGSTLNINRNIDIIAPGSVTFNQTSEGTYTETISGNGGLNIAGTETLIIAPTSNNSGFTGLTLVGGAGLQLDGQLGGLITVTSTLSGIGTANNTVLIAPGGTIEPGDSIGTLTVGDFIQSYDSFYQAEVNGAGQSDLVLATTVGTFGSGTATLNGGTVVVSSPDGTFLIDSPYTIITASGGLTGEFQTATTQLNRYLVPLLSYDSTNAFVTLNTNFQGFAGTSNQSKVAKELDTITDPSADLQTVLQDLVTLNTVDFQDALDDLSGEQYATLIEITQLSTRRFLRDLFLPFRLGQNDCLDYDPCCEDFEIWVDGHYGRSYLQNNHHARGFRTRDWDIVAGIQTSFCPCWTVGAAVFYEHNFVNFHEHGTAYVNTIDGALYGYYQDGCYYLASDLLFGYSHFDVKRHISFDDISRKAHSHPKFWDVTFYTEAGKNLSCLDCLTLQPFLGLEFDYYNLDHFREHGADSLNLSGKHKDYFDFDSRLGIRASTTLCCDVLVSAEVAWEHRYTEIQNNIRLHFEEFGGEFSVHGPKQKRDAIEGSVIVAANLCDDLRVFAEVYGERWQRFSNYDFTLGIEFRW